MYLLLLSRSSSQMNKNNLNWSFNSVLHFCYRIPQKNLIQFASYFLSLKGAVRLKALSIMWNFGIMFPLQMQIEIVFSFKCGRAKCAFKLFGVFAMPALV